MAMIETDAELGSEESHVDRAMLGPTPDNPSLSLKTRLKRARFFDQRDREVADGTAEPVDAEAGLPEQMVEDIETLGRE
jgi:resuscitation-promoting factor RpfA